MAILPTYFVLPISAVSFVCLLCCIDSWFTTCPAATRNIWNTANNVCCSCPTCMFHPCPCDIRSETACEVQWMADGYCDGELQNSRTGKAIEVHQHPEAPRRHNCFSSSSETYAFNLGVFFASPFPSCPPLPRFSEPIGMVGVTVCTFNRIGVDVSVVNDSVGTRRTVTSRIDQLALANKCHNISGER